jgi:ABC-type uncharacterized transport system substrate-binding protein
VAIQIACKPGPRALGLLLLLVGLSGCSAIDRIWEADGATEAAQAPAGAMLPDPAPPEPTRVAILLSADIDAYQGIAEQIVQRGPFNRYASFSLANGSDPGTIRRRVQSFAPEKIVAIGLSAAKFGQDFSPTPMVFCQVFNYRDHDLLSRSSKGVKLLPPFDLQLEIWLRKSPDLKTIGLIIGPNQADLLAEIDQAARRHRVNLVVRTVGSDKEMLFAFKRMTPQIQGFWLLPDNRVLSPDVLREILAYGRKHGTQTAVFSPQLLDLGADISFASRNQDVADSVLKVLGGARSKQLLFGPPMTSLTRVETKTGPESLADLRAIASEQTRRLESKH